MVLILAGVVSTACGVATVLLYRSAKRRRALGSARTVITANLLLIVMLASAAFGALDAYFRFGYEGTDNFGATPATVEWLQKYYHMNNWNWRDNVDYAAASPAGKTRITFLGDSSTEGAGIKDVDQRFGNLIRNQNPDRYDVQVFARGGNSTGKELRDLLDAYRGQGYSTDIVVVVYDLNDATDLSASYLRWERSGYERTRAAIERPWVQSSALLTMLVARWEGARNLDIGEYAKLLEQGCQGLDWQKQLLRLRLLHDLCVSQGAQMVLVSLPSHYPAIETLLNEWCREFEVPFLGLQSVFDADPTASWHVSEADGHPNERAHAAFAARIEPLLATISVPTAKAPKQSNFEEIAALCKLDWCDSVAVFKAMGKYLEAHGDHERATKVYSFATEASGQVAKAPPN